MPVRAEHAPRNALARDRHRPDVPHQRELVHDDRIGHTALERVDVGVGERRHLRDLPWSVGAKELVDVGGEVEGGDLSVELELCGPVGSARGRAVIVGDVPDADCARLIRRRVSGDKVLAVPRAPGECLRTSYEHQVVC